MPISGVEGVRADISEMLSKMRDVTNRSKIFSEMSSGMTSPAISSDKISAPQSFEDVLSVAKNAFSSVSQMQANTDNIKNAYIRGDNNVSMSEVVLSTEESKLAFEGLITVRNKLLEAYKEVMNMPV